MAVRPQVWTLAAALLTLVVLSPLAWMVSVSLTPPRDMGLSTPPLVLVHVSLSNYVRLFSDYRIARPLLNSLGLAAVATVLGLALATPAGYALAKLRFKGRERLLGLMLAAVVVPGQVSMLPLFLMMRSAHLVNSYAGVLAPFLPQIFSVLFIRQAALSIPDEMLDAARLDGAGEAQVLVRVVAPLLRPVLVSVGLFIFLSSWNEFLWTLIVLADQRLYTLPVALAALSREHAEDAGLMMAGAVVAIAPVLAIFLALQRHYVNGVLGGALKG